MKHILLKLVDGHDIICRVMELESTHIKVDNPLKVVYNMGPSGQNAMLSKYAYFSDQIIYEFKREHILQVLEPREDLVVWYEQVLQHINERDELVVEDDDSDITEEDEEYYNTLLERVRIANTQLH